MIICDISAPTRAADALVLQGTRESAAMPRTDWHKWSVMTHDVMRTVFFYGYVQSLCVELLSLFFFIKFL